MFSSYSRDKLYWDKNRVSEQRVNNNMNNSNHLSRARFAPDSGTVQHFESSQQPVEVSVIILITEIKKPGSGAGI